MWNSRYLKKSKLQWYTMFIILKSYFHAFLHWNSLPVELLSGLSGLEDWRRDKDNILNDKSMQIK